MMNADDDLPPLVVYKGDDGLKVSDFLIGANNVLQPPKELKKQPSIVSTIPKQPVVQPLKPVKIMDPRPTIISSSAQESSEHTPRRPSRTLKQNDDEELKTGDRKTERTLGSPISPQRIIMARDTDPKPQYDSQKLIEQYLRNMGPNLVYAEIENLSDAMIEKQIQKLDTEMIQESSKIKALRTEQKALPKNDIRIKYIEQEIQLVSEKLLIMDRVKNLFRDKITLRTQIFNQKALINQLAQRIVRMDTEFTEQIHQLKTYNATLPSEREQNLERKLKNLEGQFEQEKKLRENLENAVAVNIGAFQSLFTEAQEAKSLIAEQLRKIKFKQDELDHKGKVIEEHQAHATKTQHQHGGAKPAAGGSFAQHHSMSSNSSKQANPEPKGALSKMVQRNTPQQGESSFSRVGSANNKDASVLQGLNTTTEKQSDPVKGKVSLGTIKENDVSPPSQVDEQSHGNNAHKINSMVKNIRGAIGKPPKE